MTFMKLSIIGLKMKVVVLSLKQLGFMAMKIKQEKFLINIFVDEGKEIIRRIENENRKDW